MSPSRLRLLSWALALGAVLCACSFLYLTGQSYLRREAAVRETLRVREAMSDTLSLLKDVETGSRGFLLTGDQKFLEPYALARPQIRNRIRIFDELANKDLAQRASVERLEDLVQQKLEHVRSAIELRGPASMLSDEAILGLEKGKRIMDLIRIEVARMLAREEAYLQERDRAAEAAKRKTEIVLGAVLGLGILLALGGLSSARREAARTLRARIALEESERKFRLLAESATDLIRVFDEERALYYVSPSVEPLLGYRPEELIALKAGTLAHPDERATNAAYWDAARRGEATEVLTHRLRSKNGEYRWFETRIQGTLADVETGKRKWHFSSRDIHARKHAEDALRGQTALLESVLESIGDGVVVLEHDRTLVVVNHAARRFLHFAVGERMPVDWSKETQTYLADGKTLFPSEQGPLTRAMQGHASDGVELMMRLPDGGLRGFSATTRPMVRNGLTGAVAVFRDVTELRGAQKDLLESEQRYRVLSDASFEGVVITVDGLILDTNTNIAGWVGLDPSDLIGEPAIKFFAVEDHARIRELFRTDLPFAYEARMVRADGSPFPVEVRGGMVTFRGKRVRIAAIRDVTEKQKREADLEQKSEQLRALSLRDELTGLYNRRGFMELGELQLRTAARARRRLSVFFADINDMKLINDDFGHEAGDKAIFNAGSILTQVFRASDVVARLGGDEFAVLAAECDEVGVAASCSRLQRAVDTLNLGSAVPYRLSISTGAAVYDPEAPVSLQGLMHVADAQMYERKRAHREARQLTAKPANGQAKALPS